MILAKESKTTFLYFSFFMYESVRGNPGAFVLQRCVMNYQLSKWKNKRLKILRLDGYKDQVAKMYGKSIEANTVHHIYPADEYPEYQWCDWNLISVSTATHNKLENRLTGELTELGKMLKEQTIPGKDWRNRDGNIK